MSLYSSSASTPSHYLSLALDAVDFGMVVLDPNGEVLHANQRARAEMQAHRALVMAGRRLRARSVSAGAALGSAMHAASQRGLRNLIEIDDMERLVDVAVVPLRSAAAHPSTDSPAAALVMFGRRHLGEELSIQSFASHHKLTLAETHILRALCAGESVDGCAATRGVSLCTVRSQISSLRAKTNAPSTNHLVRRVAGLPPIVSVSPVCSDNDPFVLEEHS